MRILVVGKAALGETFIPDRRNRLTGGPEHLVSLLADEEMWERPRVRDESGIVIDSGQPHDVFTCTSLDQAQRYLRGLPFDLIFADDRLGEDVVAWMIEHKVELPSRPEIRFIGPSIMWRGMENLEAFNVRPVRLTTSGIRSALARDPG